MKRIPVLRALAALVLLLFASSCEREVLAPLDVIEGGAGAPAVEATAVQATLLIPGSVTVFATGFNCPSGLAFAPDGLLYVAEAGYGGTGILGPEMNALDDVIGPSGPYTGGMTGRISYVTTDGVRMTFAEGLPSCQSSDRGRFCYRGVADLKFIGTALYAIVSGAGPTHGHPTIPNSVIRVDGYSAWSVTADLSRHLKTHPSANPDMYDFEPDGLWQSMASVDNKLYAVEPNHGEFVEVDPVGRQVNRVVDISASQGHIDPSTVVFHEGYFYVGNLTQSPMGIGRAAIYRVSLAGEVTQWVGGFTEIVGIMFDKRGRMYVLEGTPCAGSMTGVGGQLVRLSLGGGWRETLVTGLNCPTAMTFGPDGALYITNRGIGKATAGKGEILRVEAPAEDW